MAGRGPRALVTLGLAGMFSHTGFHLYSASLPLYFAGLGFDPTLIGLLIGAAGVAELPGALIVGPAIDRFGGKRLLLFGASCYLTASLGYAFLDAVPALAVLRGLQGLGLAAVIPSMYSFVPELTSRRAQTRAFAGLGTAGNIAMAVCPPLGLFLLQQYGPHALFLAGGTGAVIGALFTSRVPAPKPGRRRLTLTFRRAWVPPLLVALLSVIQWGVIAAFMPIVATAAGANPALLFTADAIAILAARLCVGWFGDRVGPLWLTIGGMVCMTVSAFILVVPLTTGVLVAAGALNGLGAGLVLPPMLVQMTRRSDDSSRGSGLAYFSVAFATGVIVGSSLGGLAYPWLGFRGLMVVGGVLCGLGIVVLVQDRRLREDWNPPAPTQPNEG